MGIDTVKLSYPLQQSLPGWEWIQDSVNGNGWKATPKFGTVGPVWWCERRHEDGTIVRVKGIGSDAHLMWEGSVPKYLGIEGAASADCVRIVDRHLRNIVHRTLPAPWIRRLDVTHDEHDPDRKLLAAALGWNPHARSRYTQSVHDDRSSGGHTVWQHNKTRGVRVYDKEHESGEAWAENLVRVEYQIRGEWLERYGLDRIYEDLPRSVDRVLAPVVSDLLSRVQRNAPSSGQGERRCD